MKIPRLSEAPVSGNRLLIRLDLNVPIADGRVTSDARLLAALPTIECAFAQGAKSVLLASHLGRPPKGVNARTAPEYSLAPVARRLGELLAREVALIDLLIDGSIDGGETAQQLGPGGLGLLENVRFLPGETQNAPQLARQLAGMCDLFVMDAFATAHRAHASTTGVTEVARYACAGPLLIRELEALERVVEAPVRPFVAIIGGAKISTKLAVLERLSEISDTLVVGGAIATTLLAATGVSVGQSLLEASMLDEARRLLATARPLLPEDVLVADEVRAGATTRILPVDAIERHHRVVDIGPLSRARLRQTLLEAGCILWNGPLGVFEIDDFAAGTLHLARSVAESSAFSVVGGGDTLAALEKAGVAGDISCISTGGGALLEFVEGRTLPAIAALHTRTA